MFNERLVYFHGDKNWPRTERKFIIDSLLADKLIFGHPLSAFDFVYSHPRLSEDLVRAECHQHSISSLIDTVYDAYFDFWSQRTKRVVTDLVAVQLLEGGFLLEHSTLQSKFAKDLEKSSAVSREALTDSGGPTFILEKVREKIDSGECKIQTICPPYNQKELSESLEEMEPLTGAVKFTMMKLDEPRKYYKEHFMKPTKERLMYSATQSLARSYLYEKHGMRVVPSEGKIFQEGYRRIFRGLDQSLRESDARIMKALTQQIRINKTLRYVFKKQGAIHSLIDFSIANPIDMVQNKASSAELDDVLLRVRRKGKVAKIRNLLTKLLYEVEKGEIEEAADTKKQIEDSNPLFEINRELVDAFRQFDKPIFDKIEEKIGQELDDIKFLGNTKTFFTRIGDAIIVFGAISFLSSFIGLPCFLEGNASYLVKALQCTGQVASAEVVGLRTTAWLLKKKLASRTGLDFYAIFHDWPRATGLQ